MKRNSFIQFLILVFVLPIINWQCYEHTEGCMDVHAENYDIEADKDCMDCCTYPSLLLSVSHLMGTETIDTNFTWASNGDSLRIRSLNFYLSNFYMLNGTGEVKVSSDDYINIIPESSESDEFGKYNFTVAKVKLGKTERYNLGDFEYADIYREIQFDFGIEEEVNHANMQEIPSSNALYQNQDSMYLNQTDGFYFLKMIIEINRESEKNIHIYGDQQLHGYIFDATFDFSQREDRVIPMIIDYEKWFDGINFMNETSEMVILKLKSNMEKAIFFE